MKEIGKIAAVAAATIVGLELLSMLGVFDWRTIPAAVAGAVRPAQGA